MDCRNKTRPINRKSIYLAALHHTVTETPSTLDGLNFLLSKIETWHSKKPWAQNRKTNGKYGYYYVAYDALIGDGVAKVTQPIDSIRYHTSDCCLGKDSVNIHGIAIALAGNFTNVMPSQRQLATLVYVYAWYEKTYGLDLKVVVHREQSIKCKAPTACPGNKFFDWYKNHGGRQWIVNAVNTYKKTGKLPYGYKGRKVKNIFYVYKEGPHPTCADELKKCTEERNDLLRKVQILDNENKELKEKLRKQGLTIVELGGELKKCGAALHECRKQESFCQKLTNLIIKFLKWLIENLRKDAKNK